MVDFNAPLASIMAALYANAALLALVPEARIRNEIPGDTALPFIRVRWVPGSDFDTKDSQGLDGVFVVDIWTDDGGDKSLLDIMTAVNNVLYNNPFAGMAGAQSLILRHGSTEVFMEPDGVTRHGVMNYRHTITG
jgi:hypothetical protein